MKKEKRLTKEERQKLHYGVEDGGLEVEEALHLAKHPTKARQWIKSHFGFDPY